MADLGGLEQRRIELYARLAAVGDSRARSINETWRRRRKPNCGCAAGPSWSRARYLWIRWGWAAGPAGISWDPETRPPDRSSPADNLFIPR